MQKVEPPADEIVFNVFPTFMGGGERGDHARWGDEGTPTIGCRSRSLGECGTPGALRSVRL
jgi:hypothetical protein